MKRTIYNLTTILLMAIMSVAGSQAQVKTDSIISVIKRLSEAISTADKALVITDLSPLFSVNIASWPSSEFHLESILNSKLIEEVKMESVEYKSADTILVNVTFSLAGSKTDKSIIALDGQCKILYIDLFDRLYGASRYDKSEKKGVVKFAIQDGRIVIPLKINSSSRVYNFLFDSGADGMAISKSIADSIGLAVNHKQSAGVVGGSMEVEISRNNTIHLSDSVQLEGQNIAIFERVGGSHDGIIGLNLAKKFILEVNVQNLEMSLYTHGDYRFEVPGETINVTLPNGVIILPATLNIVGKTPVLGRFVFDTGAHYYMIGFEQFVRKNRLLLTGFQAEQTASTESMGVVSPVFIGKATSFMIGESIKLENMPIALMGSTGREYRPDMPAGSIGVNLILQYNFTIDLIRKLIHLTPVQIN